MKEKWGGFFAELRRRKVIQVGLAYAAVGYACIEAIELLFPRFRFPESAATVAVALVVLGFPAAVIIAWSRPSTRETNEGHDAGRALPLAAALTTLALAGWLALRTLSPSPPAPGLDASRGGAPGQPPEPPTRPLVVIMDSPHPDRVYDQETLEANGTNADVISDILLGLPILRQKETIGPGWHRDEEILGFEPDLIVIHYSAFRQEDSGGRRERLEMLVKFFAGTRTQFLIYSRVAEPWLRFSVTALLADLEKEHPGLLKRVHVFGVTDYGPPRWKEPAVASHLKLRVKEILGLP